MRSLSVPLFLAMALLVAACGGRGAQSEAAAEPPAVETPANTEAAETETEAETEAAVAPAEEPAAEEAAAEEPAAGEQSPVTDTIDLLPTVTPSEALTESQGVEAAEATATPLAPLAENTAVALEQVAEGLTAPMYLTVPPDGSGRLFVVDQIGVIRVIGADGTLQAEPFLDVRDRMVSLNPGYDERGLLGMAFHPDYAENGRFFVYYSAPLREGGPQGFDHTSHLAEYRVSDNPDLADPASEILLLQIDQPQSNHNGGGLAFGPDGYLYASLGDGGGANDAGPGHVEDWYTENAGGNGQDISENLLGSILRLDVDGGQPYAIPPDNPFVGQGVNEEIYAYGFRNPYSFSFDRETGDLYVADAGQNLWEEVSLVTAGGNYGWNVKEATHCFNAANPNMPGDDCPDATPEGAPLIDPVVEYAHLNNPVAQGIGLVSVGGFVYRGSAIPSLVGRYVFADWSTAWERPDGTLLVATPAAEGLWTLQELAVQGQANGRAGYFIRGFGEDEQGELYVLVSGLAGPTGNTGRVFKIAPGQGP